MSPKLTLKPEPTAPRLSATLRHKRIPVVPSLMRLNLISLGLYSQADHFLQKYNQELRELMMTLVGTVIYINEGAGEDTVTRAIPIAGQDLVGFMFGRTDAPSLETEAFRLRCQKGDEELCLTVTKTAFRRY